MSVPRTPNEPHYQGRRPRVREKWAKQLSCESNNKHTHTHTPHTQSHTHTHPHPHSGGHAADRWVVMEEGDEREMFNLRASVLPTRPQFLVCHQTLWGYKAWARTRHNRLWKDVCVTVCLDIKLFLYLCKSHWNRLFISSNVLMCLIWSST